MPKKIIVIEDDNILQTAMKTALEAAGYEVIQSFDGEEGYGKIKTEDPDLIVLDLLMPVKPGEWVLKRLNEDGRINKCPLIVLTMKADDANIENCLNSYNVKHYLVKADYSLEMLVKKIEKLLLKDS